MQSSHDIICSQREGLKVGVVVGVGVCEADEPNVALGVVEIVGDEEIDRVDVRDGVGVRVGVGVFVELGVGHEPSPAPKSYCQGRECVWMGRGDCV